MADKVCCFHCGGEAWNWEPHDEPWTGHAVFYKDCGFLRLVKGDDFIQDALRQTTPQPQPSAGETEVRRRNFTDEEVERLMEGYIYKVRLTHCGDHTKC